MVSIEGEIGRQTPRVDAVNVTSRRQRRSAGSHRVRSVGGSDVATVQSMHQGVEFFAAPRHTGQDAATFVDVL
jgi:hypothetical protein